MRLSILFVIAELSETFAAFTRLLGPLARVFAIFRHKKIEKKFLLLAFVFAFAAYFFVVPVWIPVLARLQYEIVLGHF